MDWSRIAEASVSAYAAVSTWCFEHQVETDLIIGGVVLGSLLYLARHTLRMRRLTHRIRWGVGMKRSKNRDAFERGLISFGICDAIEEAVFRGDMTQERADQWYESFASDYNMTELLPRKLNKQDREEQLKKNINWRIQFWERTKAIIPGAKPGVKVDASYKPDTTNVVALPVPESKKGKGKSRYSKAS